MEEENVKDTELESGFLDEFLSILELPEEIFESVSQLMIEELEKELRTPEAKMRIVENFYEGSTPELVREKYLEALQSFQEEEDAGNYSKQKMDFVRAVVTLIYAAYEEVLTYGINKTRINYSLCRERGKIPVPTYAKEGDSGLDVYALEDYTIAPGETVLIPLGIEVAVPSGFELQVRPKSGISLKSKLRVANTPGTIDSGYRDEVAVIIENIDPPIRSMEYEMAEDGSELKILSITHGQSYSIGKGSKFAQLVLCRVESAAFVQVDDVSSIGENRGGGFGSTGLS